MLPLPDASMLVAGHGAALGRAQQPRRKSAKVRRSCDPTRVAARACVRPSSTTEDTWRCHIRSGGTPTTRWRGLRGGAGHGGGTSRPRTAPRVRYLPGPTPDLSAASLAASDRTLRYAIGHRLSTQDAASQYQTLRRSGRVLRAACLPILAGGKRSGVPRMAGLPWGDGPVACEDEIVDDDLVAPCRPYVSAGLVATASRSRPTGRCISQRRAARRHPISAGCAVAYFGRSTCACASRAGYKVASRIVDIPRRAIDLLEWREVTNMGWT
jgi:hypothetical protein